MARRGIPVEKETPQGRGRTETSAVGHVPNSSQLRLGIEEDSMTQGAVLTLYTGRCLHRFLGLSAVAFADPHFVLRTKQGHGAIYRCAVGSNGPRSKSHGFCSLL